MLMNLLLRTSQVTQGFSLQALVCSEGPSQSPPYGPWGGGWVQVLDRVSVPPPQVTEHLPQDPQREKPPSTPGDQTAYRKSINCKILLISGGSAR